MFDAEEVGLIPETRSHWEHGARIRADTGLKTADALPAATTLQAERDLFTTIDADFRRVEGLSLAILSDLVEEQGQVHPSSGHHPRRPSGRWSDSRAGRQKQARRSGSRGNPLRPEASSRWEPSEELLTHLRSEHLLLLHHHRERGHRTRSESVLGRHTCRQWAPLDREVRRGLTRTQSGKLEKRKAG